MDHLPSVFTGGNLRDKINEIIDAAALKSRLVACVEDFGIILWTSFDAVTGYPTGVFPDHSPAYQALATALGGVGGGVITCRTTGAIIFGSSIVSPMGVHHRFSNRKRPFVSVGVYDWAGTVRLIPSATGVFKKSDGTNQSVAVDGHCRDAFLFWGNIDPADPTNYLNAGGIPDIGVGSIKDINVFGSPVNGIGIAIVAGAYVCEDWRGDMISCAVRRQFGGNFYTDKFSARRFSFPVRADNTTRLIDVRGLGDGLTIDTIECGVWNDGTIDQPAVGIEASNTRAGVVRNVINGIHTFTKSCIDISSLHIESGQVILDGFQGTVRDSWIFNDGVRNPILVKNSQSGNGDRTSWSFGGLRFVAQPNWNVHGASGWPVAEVMDIYLDTGSGSQEIIDEGTSRRIVAVNGQLDKTTVLHPLIGDSNGRLADLASYGPMLQSKVSRINQGKVSVTGVVDSSGVFNGMTIGTFTATAGGMSFKAATATYYYQAQLVFDVTRKIGRGITGSPAAVSVAATNGAAVLPQLTFDLSGMSSEGGYFIRVYRGSADGSYDKYADIPVASIKYAWDDGNCIASIPWKTRAAGVADTLNSGLTGTGSRLVLEAGGIVAKGVASRTPTVGTWKQGDKTELLAQTADGNNMVIEGATCTVAGTPGTFVDRRFSTVSPAV